MSSDDDDGDFAYFGTAVEQPDEDNIIARKAPRLEDQVVTDKQGRRRFHGAFTGGFSAGHFNSVGSVEGFTPSTFTSSRAERNKAVVAQDVTMFMDEEDTSAHGIAARKLQATSDFSSGDPGVGKRKRQLPSSGPIPGTPVLLDLVSDTNQSIGVRLLRSLGWREGQGVGPRLSHREKKKIRKRMQKQKRKGDNAGQSDSSNEEDNSTLPPEYSQATFAPEDYSSDMLSLLLRRRTNTFGLGYQPLSRNNILGPTKDGWMHRLASFSVTAEDDGKGTAGRGNKKKTMTIRGQAFGVGAFEEEDEDIYGTEDMTRYDFTLGGAKGAPGAKTDDPSIRGMAGKGGVTPGGMNELCEVLEGFVLSSAPVVAKAPPPLPSLPSGYVPCHRPLRKRFSSRAFEQSGLGRHDLSHTDRHRILEGGAKANVEVRVGIKGIKPPTPPPPASHPRTPHQPQEEEGSASSETKGQVPLAELLGEEFEESSSEQRPSAEYKPFAKDLKKQKRYELYMRMKEKGLRGRYGETQPSSLTEWEKAREVQEFERAAALYKPLTAAMATRFVSSAVQDGTPLLKDGLNMNIKSITSSMVKSSTSESSTGTAFSTSSSEPAAPPPSTDPRVNAAHTGMFGKMTLLVQDWHPDRLLCKRFNVPQPYPESRHIGVISADGRGSRQKDSGGSNIFSFLSSTPTLAGPSSRQSKAGSSDRGREDSVKKDKKKESRWEADSEDQPSKKKDYEQSSRWKEVEVTSEDEKETPEKYGLKVPVDGPPTMDLFKAIFDDSSSDSDDSSSSDSEEDEGRRPKSSETPSTKDAAPASKSGAREESNKVRKSRFEAHDDSDSNSINSRETMDGGSITSRMKEGSPRLDSDDVIMGRSPPRHVFVSKKVKSASVDGSDVSAAANGDPVKVSFVKGVKDKKQSLKARSTVSKSSLSFVIESDDEEDSNFDKSKKSKLPLFSSNTKNKVSSKLSDHLRDDDSVPQRSESSEAKQKCKSNEQESRVKNISNSEPRGSPSRLVSQNVKSSSRDSELPQPLKLSESSATGIFANIDFVELNRYRGLMNQDSEDPLEASSDKIEKSLCASDKVEKSLSTSKTDHEYLLHHSSNQDKSKGGFNRRSTTSKATDKLKRESSSDDSDSSVDSEDAYGAALPPNFVNPMQVIKDNRRSKKTTTDSTSVGSGDSWKERTSESIKKKSKKKEKKNRKDSKHRSKSSHRKDKKKKSKKEKKKKEKRRRSESPSSKSSFSSSD